MTTSRIELIRKEEKMYHDQFYEKNRLFEKGSWLVKPVQTVMEQLLLFEDKLDFRVLDLGSGVGRNSIPIAEKIKSTNGKVVCVDLLDSAIEKLKQYSFEYGVQNVIQPVKSDLADYQIKEADFDMILAVSSLEHVATESSFETVVQQMALGTRKKGINCLIVNSQVEEYLVETNEKLDALIEINLPTSVLLNKLNLLYGDDWQLLKQEVKSLEYLICRQDNAVLMKTNALTYVVQKM